MNLVLNNLPRLICHKTKTNLTVPRIGEAKTDLSATFYYGPLHMDSPVLTDKQRLAIEMCRNWM